MALKLTRIDFAQPEWLLVGSDARQRLLRAMAGAMMPKFHSPPEPSPPPPPERRHEKNVREEEQVEAIATRPPPLSRDEHAELEAQLEVEPLVVDYGASAGPYRGSIPPPSRPAMRAPSSPEYRAYVARMNQVLEGPKKPFLDPLWRVALRTIFLQ